MSKESEEKSLPASEKKLRDARKKGQVSNSRDLLAGISFVAVLCLLFFFQDWFYERFVELVENVTRVDDRPFDTKLLEAGALFFQLLFLVVLPILATLLVFLILPAIGIMRGLIFSFELVKPQFDHLSPVTGFKRIASLRNVIEFTKALLKVAFLSAVFVVIGIGWLNPLFLAPSCGTTCLAPILVGALTAFGIAGAVGFIVLGAADVPVQRWLFARDMRMTRSEYKREQRDIEGDPLIRREFHRLRSEAVSAPRKGSAAHPTLVLVGADRAIALRFVNDETPMPVVVGKGEGKAASQLEAAARSAQIPVVEDADVVKTMFARSQLGQYVHSDFFPLVVPHLVRLNQV